MKSEVIHNLSELIRSNYFQSFESSKLGNDLFINDPERAERIHNAAESGCDGSTHGEHIEDFRECNELAEREIYRPMFRAMGFECFEELATALREYIELEIQDTEEFHAKNGTLDRIVN